MKAGHFTLASCADDLALHVHTWTPSGGPRGLVQIHHGMAEHAARYHPVAEALVAAGFVVWAPDHRGHGKSVPVGQVQGHFGDTDGWDHAVEDLAQLQRKFREQYPDLPSFAIGHSMGSFLTMQFIMSHGQDLAGVVLTGTTGHPGPLRHIGALVVRIEERRLGLLGKSALIDKMSFGSFNDAIENPRTSFDWLSRDRDQVDAYVADPDCGFILTTRSWRQLLHALRLIHRDDHIARIPQHVPVLVVCGDADPVGQNGQGVRKLVESWQQAGHERITLKLIPGARHEVFNETDRDETIQLVVDWLTAALES
jgi:alpha-beta hydrolase superfamily lysophospholipase